ncbi:hypothetical protein AV530_004264 [Patagioenas fasciata monilis]|uniref:Uncharacterized protein n=1 Tax=Patagioenas fasciata monilis TaxID=372326 RepID=A0A1V4K8U7_PATFA|nr:hypothetical protein AV530_004264 [Patagioenas fasciata monilis]
MGRHTVPSNRPLAPLHASAARSSKARAVPPCKHDSSAQRHSLSTGASGEKITRRAGAGTYRSGSGHGGSFTG